MKCLVTGATGFLGTNIVHELVKNGWQVRAFGLPGSNVDLGPGWAYGLAAPLRLMKGYQTQGGVRSPLIIKPPHIPPSNPTAVAPPASISDSNRRNGGDISTTEINA